MLFNSLSFLIFFPLVVVGYYLLPEKARTYFLLVASCVFYMAFVPKYIFVLFSLITIDFFLARIIERNTGSARRACLWASVTANIGLLFFFKYFNFFNINIGALAHFLGWNYSPTLLTFLLPLGLSFHVFQSLSYVIEVYRGKVPAEKNYFLYALYVMFFPQLVAGPIERPQHLLPQFRSPHPFNEARVILGLERMLWGFFKKLVIADNCALIVNTIYASHTTEGPALLLAVVLFAYQIYGDFSGYSDIAVGSALVLGYEITENFQYPFTSRSVAEFWRRWHISLSSWLRDYLYYPLALGGGHHSKTRLYVSLFVTFVLIGLWHGANWTFVAMGTLFGIYLIVGSLTQRVRQRISEKIGITKLPALHALWQTGCTLALVSFAWIFFRAPSIADALHVIANLGNGLGQLFDLHYLRYRLFADEFLGFEANKSTVIVIVLAVLSLEWVQRFGVRAQTLSPWANWSPTVRTVWRYATLFAILVFGYLGGQSFIYFKF